MKTSCSLLTISCNNFEPLTAKCQVYLTNTYALCPKANHHKCFTEKCDVCVYLIVYGDKLGLYLKGLTMGLLLMHFFLLLICRSGLKEKYVTN